MTLKSYLEKVCMKEYHEIKDKTISDLIAYMYKCETPSIYIVDQKKPIYIFTSTDILEIFLKELIHEKISDFMKKNPKTIKMLPVDTNMFDAYYYMRSNQLKHLPIVDQNGALLGEITFKSLSLKISDIAIKDPLTGLFNQRYFSVLLEEYKEFFDKPMGIICIELTNLSILKGFYNLEDVNELIKEYASAIKSCIRDVDFAFRIESTFKIITFSNLEITDKIANRIKAKLEKTEYNGIKASFNVALSNVPELEDSIILALENCEKRLIKGD